MNMTHTEQGLAREATRATMTNKCSYIGSKIIDTTKAKGEIKQLWGTQSWSGAAALL